MALINCSECGKEVSSKAVACPNCGNPIAAIETPLSTASAQSPNAVSSPTPLNQSNPKEKASKATVSPGTNPVKVVVSLVLLTSTLALMQYMMPTLHGNNETSSTNTRPHVTNATQRPAEPKLSTANQIANVDIGGYVSPSDPSVTRINYLLGQVAQKTGESESSIGDKLVYAKNTLRDQYGVTVSMLTLLEEAKGLIEDSPAPVTFTEAIAVLVMQHGR